MEGFLQSLKVQSVAEQVRVCGLIGAEAQNEGRRHNWSATGTLWWQGQPIDRLSDQYQVLLDRAYDALCAESQKFRSALAATGTVVMTHRSGKSDPCETILTEEEFCSRLAKLRERLRSEGY